MRVFVSGPTRLRLRQRARWWHGHREHPEIFDNELRDALDQLRLHARAYRVDTVLKGHEIHHIVMKKSGTALYYYVDDIKSVVRVVGVHGTVRGSQPELDV